jgi:hypothetical protein
LHVRNSLLSRIVVVVGCGHLPGIAPAITLRILRPRPPVNHRFIGPRRGDSRSRRAAGHDSAVTLVKRPK